MSIEKNKIEAEIVINLIKDLEGVDKKKEVAEILKIELQQLSHWKGCGTVPWQALFNYSIEKNISLDSLLRGEIVNVDRDSISDHELSAILKVAAISSEKAAGLASAYDKLNKEYKKLQKQIKKIEQDSKPQNQKTRSP